MMKRKVFLVFPHQLFEDVSPLFEADEVYLVEEFLFFNQYRFHKQKLLLHRASMKYYENYLLNHNLRVTYVAATDPKNDVRLLISSLHKRDIGSIRYYDVCDQWLEKRLRQSCEQYGFYCEELPTPLFINSKADLKSYFDHHRHYFQTDFYIQQRKKLAILIDANGKPEGGKWSYDAENRLKYPKAKQPPRINFPELSGYHQEAAAFVEKHYPNNYGSIDEQLIYPVTHRQSLDWLKQFLEYRFAEFGAYEDAMVSSENFLHHSVLSPMLNTGLLLPMQVVRAAIEHARNHQIGLGSLEGFIRQIIGWREFIRGVYVYRGSRERTMNFWRFHQSLPAAFYEATTGIPPLDTTIRKLLQTGYNHHIERLMILGNFMLLCEIHPDEVYKWFMEMYIDAYDWVMVPNVYGMSQFADGGLMATKPYLSGSSYVLKMSNFSKGEWCETWDALFWQFMDKYRSFFLTNPRLGMLIKTFDKMDEEKKQLIRQRSKAFLDSGLFEENERITT